MTYDIIIIGGSYAGIAAALQLARARRSVLVIDAGERRNRFADHSYGFVGQDGADPAATAAMAWSQLVAYPTVRWVDGRAETASGRKDAFTVRTADGAHHDGRRLLFATGLTDTLPAIPGLAERWGKGVFHCPYCHGYELDRGPIGVIATGPMSLHQAQLVPEWGPVTFLTNGALELDAAAAADLARRGVAVEPAPVAAIVGRADVRLADGRILHFAGIFTCGRTAPASPVAATLGCANEHTSSGTQILTDDSGETTIPGAFACGDAARAPHSVSLAVADGAMAGGQVHQSLVF